MKTFVINLDQDYDRWKYMQRQLNDADLDFQRISGVLGRSLKGGELDTHYSRSRASWRQARPLTPSEIGCALSHLKIYREIMCRDLPHALILEDDVVIGPDIPSLLTSLESHMKADEPKVCLLSPAEPADNGFVANLYPPYSLQRFGSGYFTSSYVVTHAAAERLLAQLYPVGDVADCWERINSEGMFEVLNVTPAAIEQNQDNFGSSTTKDIQASLGNLSAMLRYKVLRVRNILFGPIVTRFREAASEDIVTAASRHPLDSLLDR